MKLIAVICSALCLVLGTSLAARAQSADEQVKAAYAAWDEAFNKKDAKALAAFYTDDAIFLPPSHDILEGPAGVEKFFTAIFGMGATDHKFELIKAEEKGDVVFGAAKWSAKGKDAKGADQPVGRSGYAYL